MTSNQQRKFSETYLFDMGRGDFSSEYRSMMFLPVVVLAPQKFALLFSMGSLSIVSANVSLRGMVSTTSSWAGSRDAFV